MNDEIYQAILGKQPAAAAPPAPAARAPTLAPAPSSERTAAKEQGLKDLQRDIDRMEALLKDVTPGSPTHQRVQSNLMEARRELARGGGAPVPAAPLAGAPAEIGDEIYRAILGKQPSAPAPTAAAPTPAPMPETAAAVPEPTPTEPSGVTSVARKLFGGLEAVGGAVGGVLTAPVAGLRGLYELAATRDPAAAARAVEETQAALMGRLTGGMTPEGQQYSEALARGMQTLNVPAERIGESALGMTGSPAAATAAEIALNPLNLAGALVPARGALAARTVRQPTPVTPAAPLPGGARILTPEETIARQTVPTVAERMARAEGGMPAAAPAAVGAAPAAGAATVPATAAGAQAAAGQPAPFGSVGAAAATRSATLDTAIAMATPEAAAELQAIKARGGRINQRALDRQIEADSLPIPVRLTPGQATGDVVRLSDEFNMRGKPGGEAIAYRLKQQNDALQENLVAIRDAAAPNVYGTNITENGQLLINAYKQIDEARNLQIRGLYKQLEDAAGGRFPVDGKAFVTDADRLLAKKLKTEFVPPTIRRQMEQFREGPMNFEQFEALRTNIASEIRKAERAGDGNAEMALGLVRQSLENLPMTGADAVRLKGLADQARAAARARFQMLEKDPAYKAAVSDRVAPDDFVNKFVISGKRDNIRTMVDQFGRGSDAHQVMQAGTMNWLRSKAGIVGEAEGNFSQAGYNKALQTLEPRLLDIVEADTANQLRTLGNVARYTQQQRTGSFASTSSSATQLLRAGVGRTAQVGVEAAVPGGGFIIGAAKEMAAKRAAERELREILKPMAGVELPKGKKGKAAAAAAAQAGNQP